MLQYIFLSLVISNDVKKIDQIFFILDEYSGISGNLKIYYPIVLVLLITYSNILLLHYINIYSNYHNEQEED